jgi:hypothetical protein
MHDGDLVTQRAGWIFGYKLHLISNTGGSIIVPLAADFTIANITDNKIYDKLITNLPVTIIKRTLFMSADLAMMIINCMISVAVWDFD